MTRKIRFFYCYELMKYSGHETTESNCIQKECLVNADVLLKCYRFIGSLQRNQIFFFVSNLSSKMSIIDLYKQDISDTIK
jgi:hypothetical protein